MLEALRRRGESPAREEACTLHDASLIIWDEISLASKYMIDAVDRLLQDVTQCHLPVGGKTVVRGGDFRQVSPVIRNASRTALIDAMIKRSKTWGHVREMRRGINMRNDEGEGEFAEWLLVMGDGRLPTGGSTGTEIDCIVAGVLVDQVFGENVPLDGVAATRSTILCSGNEEATRINDTILECLRGELVVYRNVDSVEDADDEQEASCYPRPVQLAHAEWHATTRAQLQGGAHLDRDGAEELECATRPLQRYAPYRSKASRKRHPCRSVHGSRGRRASADSADQHRSV